MDFMKTIIGIFKVTFSSSIQTLFNFAQQRRVFRRHFFDY